MSSPTAYGVLCDRARGGDVYAQLLVIAIKRLSVGKGTLQILSELRGEAMETYE